MPHVLESCGCVQEQRGSFLQQVPCSRAGLASLQPLCGCAALLCSALTPDPAAGEPLAADPAAVAAVIPVFRAGLQAQPAGAVFEVCTAAVPMPFPSLRLMSTVHQPRPFDSFSPEGKIMHLTCQIFKGFFHVQPQFIANKIRFTLLFHSLSIPCYIEFKIELLATFLSRK